MNFKNVLTIAKKDFKAYFNSPIAYIVMAVFSFIMGYMFFSILSIFIMQNMQFEQFRMGRGPNLTDNLIRPIWGNMNVVLLFIVPFITMRLFAEERKNNTIELLFTSPVKLSEIILGKYLSAFMFVVLLVALTIPYPFTLYMAAKPDWGVISMCYLGTLLMIGVYIAVGALCSSVTENQIIAGALTFGAILFFWIIKWASYSAGQPLSEILSYLSVIDHFEDFSRGVFNTKDFVFFISSIITWLFLSYKTLESYTWRA
jgi:ABC-2 type transport system permease protein